VGNLAGQAQSQAGQVSMKTLLVFILAVFCASAHAQTDDECLILLHGMGRTSASMAYLGGQLEDAGFRVVNYGYPSTSYPIEQLATEHIPLAMQECGADDTQRYHFVTHSLGGILVRYYLQENTLPQGSRVVMISPPNSGSELADSFKDKAYYQWLTGPPGQQLGTSEDDLPKTLKPVDAEIGVITGVTTLEPWFSRLLPGDDDGKVTVESAQLDEMKDFLVVDSGHTFIMNSSEVIAAVENFLRQGSFAVEEQVTAPEPVAQASKGN
jgi:triacylglycerol lipase